MRETFGYRLKKARKERKWSQMKLELMSGVAQTAISAYELDRREPGIFAAICLADALGVSMDWLTGRTDKVGGR